MALKIRKFGLLYFIGIILVSFSISPLCVIFMTTFLSFNFSELFLIPGFILILFSSNEIKNEFIYNLRRKQFVQFLVLLILFFLIGIVTGDSIALVYADFRTIAVFLFFAVLRIRTVNRQELMKKIIYHIFFTLSLLDLIFLYLRKSSFNIDDDRFIVMTICPFVISILFLHRNKFILSLLFLGILIYETIVSTMRINYILIIFYIFYMFFLIIGSIKNNNVSLIKTFVFVVIISIFAVKITPKVMTYLEASGSRYVHSVVRTEDTFNNFEEGEAIRINTTFLFIKEPLEFIVPQGLGWRNHIKIIQSKFREQYGVLSTMDSNIFYCIYHFGLFIGLVIIYLIFRLFISNLIKLKKRTSFLGFIYYFIITSIVLSMFILKSWIFVYLNFGFIYSLLIVLSRYPDKDLLKRQYQ